MLKVLLLVLLVAAVGGWFWAGQRRQLQRRRQDAQLQAMTPCAHCGLNVPAREAVLHDGKSFCSVAHRDLGAAPS